MAKIFTLEIYFYPAVCLSSNFTTFCTHVIVFFNCALRECIKKPLLVNISFYFWRLRVRSKFILHPPSYTLPGFSVRGAGTFLPGGDFSAGLVEGEGGCILFCRSGRGDWPLSLPVRPGSGTFFDPENSENRGMG